MPTFEDRLLALEAVVERLERGELTLEDSVRLFEEGVNLSNNCKLELERAEGRIQILVEAPAGRGLVPAEMELDEENLTDTRDDEDEDEDEE